MPRESNRKILREAILSVFDPGELRQTLAEGTPSRDFDKFVVQSVDYEQQIFQLIDRADKGGWLQELIETLLAKLPGNKAFLAKVQPIVERLAAGQSLDDLAPGADVGPPPSAKRAAIWAGLPLGIVAVAATWWWLGSVHKGSYQVFVQFAGINRGDVKTMMQRLRGDGWRVQGVDGGGEESVAARGKNEVRFREDTRAAQLLADQVRAEQLGSGPIAVVRVPSIDSKTLEVWVSRPIPAESSSSVADEAWSRSPPNVAYCYQRDRVLPGQKRFLVRCFQTNDLCLMQRQQDLGRMTSCIRASGLVSLAEWKQAGKGGVLNSWYLYWDGALPKPLPQFD